MPSFVLPSRPSVEQLKRQARELRQSYLDSDAAAHGRVRPFLALLRQPDALTLTDAKLVLAREYGFDSWPKLKHHVEALRDDYDQLGNFMDLVTSGEADRAKFISDHGFATQIVRSGIQVGVHVAARFDLLERLVSLLEEVPERAHERDGMGLTPLHWAGSARIWQVLVHNYEADPEARDTSCGATPAQWAVIDHRQEIARLLVDGGTQVDPVLLCGLGMVAKLRDLLRAEPGSVGKLEMGGIPGGEVYARALGQRTTLLHVAAHFSGKEATRMLLAEGADPEATDAGGATALHRAAGRGDQEIVSLLLERGAPVSATDSAGGTPLQQAALHGHADVARLLLERGANPSAVDADGTSALHAAVQAATATHHGPQRRDRAVEIAGMLVDAGVPAVGVGVPTGRDNLDALLARAAD